MSVRSNICCLEVTLVHMLRAVFDCYGELVTYVRKDYLSMSLCSHVGYIGCELILNGMVDWLHMSKGTILLCCFEVTLVT